MMACSIALLKWNSPPFLCDETYLHDSFSTFGCCDPRVTSQSQRDAVGRWPESWDAVSQAIAAAQAIATRMASQAATRPSPVAPSPGGYNAATGTYNSMHQARNGHLPSATDLLSTNSEPIADF